MEKNILKQHLQLIGSLPSLRIRTMKESVSAIQKCKSEKISIIHSELIKDTAQFIDPQQEQINMPTGIPIYKPFYKNVKQLQAVLLLNKN